MKFMKIFFSFMKEKTFLVVPLKCTREALTKVSQINFFHWSDFFSVGDAIIFGHRKEYWLTIKNPVTSSKVSTKIAKK